MTSLERKKMELELMRVSAAKKDHEIRVEEMGEEVARLLANIKVQENKEQELQQKLREGK